MTVKDAKIKQDTASDSDGEGIPESDPDLVQEDDEGISDIIVDMNQ
jgi:hypothetical protein